MIITLRPAIRMLNSPLLISARFSHNRFSLIPKSTEQDNRVNYLAGLMLNSIHSNDRERAYKLLNRYLEQQSDKNFSLNITTPYRPNYQYEMKSLERKMTDEIVSSKQGEIVLKRINDISYFLKEWKKEDEIISCVNKLVATTSKDNRHKLFSKIDTILRDIYENAIEEE